MTPDVVLGQPALFEIVEADDSLRGLSSRERRLLVGALNFHALMAPGARFEVHLYDGDHSSLPRTTDDTTFSGYNRAFRSRIHSFAVRSHVSAEERTPIQAEARSGVLTSSPRRHLRISRDEVLSFDPPRGVPRDLLRRFARQVRTRAPLVYDEIRDLELLRHRRPTVSAAPRREYQIEFLPGGSHSDSEIVLAPRAVDGAPRAVLFGLHWLELGGAERWALESVRIARDAGFLPIVLTNRDSHQAWAARDELEGCLLIPFSEPTVTSQTPGVEELLRAILRSFDIRGVVVHHNQWLYDRLHWITESRPGIPVVDSTHIVERRGGGYPVSSALVETAITTHHVISPSLEKWMVATQGIDARKVVMAPLAGLTVDLADSSLRPRPAGEPLTVAFIGRMTRQKAPEVFAAMAQRVRRRESGVKFIMHGDGDLSGWVDDLIKSYGLSDVVVRRDSTVPVGRTLDESHLLVVTSHNEGLTLTTLEAIAHGVPVISTDVGAQSDLLPHHALVSSNVHRAVIESADKVLELAENEKLRADLWLVERAAERELLAHESASSWFEREVSSW
ncbi:MULTISPECIES: glycosyltransferase [Bacteria]